MFKFIFNLIKFILNWHFLLLSFFVYDFLRLFLFCFFDGIFSSFVSFFVFQWFISLRLLITVNFFLIFQRFQLLRSFNRTKFFIFVLNSFCGIFMRIFDFVFWYCLFNIFIFIFDIFSFICLNLNLLSAVFVWDFVIWL